VFLIQGLTKGDWVSAFTFALAVAVGLTPEMLPMIVSANLAKGAVAMARRKVVVKRLNAVQNFGAMDVLCTDKTGTLTCDRIALTQWLDIEGRIDDSVLRLAWLNSYHQTGRRNPIDLAILDAASRRTEPLADGNGAHANRGNYQRVDELAFDFLRRRLSVIVERSDGLQRLICKGAVEEVLAVSRYVMQGGQRIELTQAMRQSLVARARALAESGQRVLLIACRDVPREAAKRRYDVADEHDLAVHGLLAFMDPPKESAAPALAALRAKGIAVKVLTGDTAAVAQTVCREVGIEVGEALTGDEIDRMDDEALAVAVKRTALFARLAPLQKARIVCALKAHGHTVGFLGDGINDAPALRDADVGISVDNGADIAKETADIILLEKSLTVLETGVVKGRETFGNILKYLNMTASSNFGNVFSVLVASAVLPWEPMLALQLLLQNLIYDLSQMLLPWDRMDEEFLAKPRKWDAGNIGRFMIWLGPTSSVFDMTTFALLWYIFGAGHLYHAHGGDGGQIIMNSGWFIEGLVSQTLVVHLLRTRKLPFFQSTASWQVLLSTSCAIAFGCWLPFSPFAASLGFTHLPSSYWGWLIATMIGYVALAQVVKTVYVKVYGKWF
ncbi:MAG: magnesium-translocating P-type ATPase, partial [Janthinobacterium lividum]